MQCQEPFHKTLIIMAGWYDKHFPESNLVNLLLPRVVQTHESWCNDYGQNQEPSLTLTHRCIAVEKLAKCCVQHVPGS